MVYLRKLMSNVFFLKYFTINYVLNFLNIIFNEKSFTEKFLITTNITMRKQRMKILWFHMSNTVNWTCKLSCACTCSCACDSTRLREQCAVGMLVHFHKTPIQMGQPIKGDNVVLGWHIFRNLNEKNTWQK